MQTSLLFISTSAYKWINNKVKRERERERERERSGCFGVVKMYEKYRLGGSQSFEVRSEVEIFNPKVHCDNNENILTNAT